MKNTWSTVHTLSQGNPKSNWDQWVVADGYGENIWVTQTELIMWVGNYDPQKYTVCTLFL